MKNKFEVGDKVIYNDKITTITKVENLMNAIFFYQLGGEHPDLFVKEEDLQKLESK